MAKTNLSDIDVPALIADMWNLLNEEQRTFLAEHFTLQCYKKNEVIHCEDETPTHLMCLLSGKVKIYKDGVGGRSQIIRMIKPVGYFGYAACFAGKDYVTAAAAFEPSIICLIRQPDAKAHPRATGRIAALPQGKLRTGRRRFDA